jgi:hypothetical protein
VEVVERHDVGWNLGEGDAHVFRTFHWSFQVEIFDVNGHEFGIWSGKDTVEQDFGSSKVGRLGADVANVCDFVAAAGPANAFGDGFIGIIGDHNFEVGCLAAFGDFGDVDEMNGVSARYFVLEVALS